MVRKIKHHVLEIMATRYDKFSTQSSRRAREDILTLGKLPSPHLSDDVLRPPLLLTAGTYQTGIVEYVLIQAEFMTQALPKDTCSFIRCKYY